MPSDAAMDMSNVKPGTDKLLETPKLALDKLPVLTGVLERLVVSCAESFRELCTIPASFFVNQLEADGKPLALARAWQIASQPDLVSAQPTAPPPERPASGPVPFFEGVSAVTGYAAALEWRFVSGAFDTLGAAEAWTRVRIPLVEGQPLSGFQRVLVAADSANGISAVLPFRDWVFVPTALTVTLHRHPQSEWVFMRAETLLSDDGIGSCLAELADDLGTVGSASQPLVITRRQAD